MLRKISWVVAVIAYVIPPVWGYYNWRSYLAEEKAAGRLASGDYAIAVVIIAGLVAGLLSLISTGFGVAAYVRHPSPRPRYRIAEIAACALPLLLVVVEFTFRS